MLFGAADCSGGLELPPVHGAFERVYPNTIRRAKRLPVGSSNSAKSTWPRNPGLAAGVIGRTNLLVEPCRAEPGILYQSRLDDRPAVVGLARRALHWAVIQLQI